MKPFASRMLLALSVTCSANAFAQFTQPLPLPPVVKDPSGAAFKPPYPVCKAMSQYPTGTCNSKGGTLDGQTIVTQEKKWKSKMVLENHFPVSSDKLKVGERAAIAVMVKNPAEDAAHRALLTCDLYMVKPDGGVAVSEKGFPCYDAEAPPRDAIMPLLAAERPFAFDNTDPLGVWMVIVVAMDAQGKSASLMWTRVENVGAGPKTKR